ncbi:hypothetical protein CEP54_006120 [Fusarium duplospermum]|uniref:Uncharacterized protein n=1 Tax=Fusarium duplospermum TaxID=1325734 RepID=A0A428Q8W8_9HYPO|nr:hypothetical protein CEP54_006120 [Fusarium duplospermum]
MASDMQMIAKPSSYIYYNLLHDTSITQESSVLIKVSLKKCHYITHRIHPRDMPETGHVSHPLREDDAKSCRLATQIICAHKQA